VDAFVPKDTPIDQHAARETTSVYTGVSIFPMLPNALSTGASSLLPDVDRPPWSPNSSSTPAGAIGSSNVVSRHRPQQGSTHLQCRRSLARSDGRRSAKSRRVSPICKRSSTSGRSRAGAQKTPLRARRAEHRHQRSQRHNAQCAGDRRREAAQEPRHRTDRRLHDRRNGVVARLLLKVSSLRAS